MNDTPRTLATGKHLHLCSRSGWEYATRAQASGVVGIIAVTPANELLLVEQHRIPINGPAIELPAGLVGDEVAGEDLLLAARRELEEETGYTAERLRVLNAGPSSAGLTNEVVSLVLAQQLSRVGDGGGVPGENITVHAVPLANVPAWLQTAAARGALIDHKVHAGLWWLGQIVTPKGNP